MLDDIHLDERLNYMESLVVILDRKTKTLRKNVIGLVKVQWQHRKGLEQIQEPEEEMCENYPGLFMISDFGDEIRFKWGGDL